MSKEPWGISSSIDLYNCNPEIIRSVNKIKLFVKILCNLIHMKRFGDTQIVRFGTGAAEGYSMIQLIETSLISGHFANESNAAYLDIFSCKAYDPDTVAVFAQHHFEAESYRLHIIKRE